MSNETLCGLQFQSHHMQLACTTTVKTQITDKAYNSFVFVIIYQKILLLIQHFITLKITCNFINSIDRKHGKW
jgi:hypothetical protein